MIFATKPIDGSSGKTLNVDLEVQDGRELHGPGLCSLCLAEDADLLAACQVCGRNFGRCCSPYNSLLEGIERYSHEVTTTVDARLRTLQVHLVMLHPELWCEPTPWLVCLDCATNPNPSPQPLKKAIPMSLLTPDPKPGTIVRCIEEHLGQLQPAIVCKVGPPVPNGNAWCNLAIFREDGGQYARTSVPHYFEGCSLGWIGLDEPLPAGKESWE